MDIPELAGEKFQIPMRGNENGEKVPLHEDTPMFQIPMRGNERDRIDRDEQAEAGSKSP